MWAVRERMAAHRAGAELKRLLHAAGAAARRLLGLLRPGLLALGHDGRAGDLAGRFARAVLRARHVDLEI